jgi:hypothetical protein
MRAGPGPPVLIEPDVQDRRETGLHPQLLVASSRASSRSSGLPPPPPSPPRPFRVVSELLPRSTQSIHAAILGRRPSGGSQESCTCYQCHAHRPGEGEAGRKVSREELVPDINSNLVAPESPASAARSTVLARRHLRRAATQGRILTQAELLKLQHFRRFLHSSGLSQLDFLLRVEQLRRSREDEQGQEVDEEGRPHYRAG